VRSAECPIGKSLGHEVPARCARNSHEPGGAAGAWLEPVDHSQSRTLRQSRILPSRAYTNINSRPVSGPTWIGLLNGDYWQRYVVVLHADRL
jgi:hypothetical protein